MSKNFLVHFVPYQTPRPEFEGKPAQIRNIAYDEIPPWHIIQEKLTMARTVPALTGIFNAVDLTALNQWHVLNASSIYTTYIPNRYLYIFDATGALASTSINDGGFDMFDSANFISISTTRGATNILSINSNLYGILSNIPAQNFGYFITSRNVWPQVSLAYIKEGSILWRFQGNVGSDGVGNQSNVSSIYTTTRGFTGRFWANQGFGTPDPTICTTWFTIESTNWNTIISSSNIGWSTTPAPPNIMNQFAQVTGSNFLFGAFLLSARRTTPTPNGFFISTSFIENFLSNYVENANILVS